MLTCLFQLSILLFLAINTTIELWEYNLNGLEIESTAQSTDIEPPNHALREVASKQDTNSTSIVEVEVALACLQDTTPPTSLKVYHDIDVLVSMQSV